MQIKTIESKLMLMTGLHIGAEDDTMKIGGVDSVVITREIFSDKDGKLGFPLFDKDDKNKIINDFEKHKEPYIAGSSLKGKIRSLLEHYFKLINPVGKGDVVDSESNFGDIKKRDLIIKLFGESAGEKKKGNITRVIFRDCFITKNVRQASLNKKIELFETKAENVINRVLGTAEHPRFIQRVPSGVEFDFNMSLRIFENDDEELFKNTILLGIKLLELDALGGSGSRGYGRVEFTEFKDKKIEDLADCIDKLLKKEECDGTN